MITGARPYRAVCNVRRRGEERICVMEWLEPRVLQSLFA
jgi:hypothetical protein